MHTVRHHRNIIAYEGRAADPSSLSMPSSFLKQLLEEVLVCLNVVSAADDEWRGMD